MSPRITVVPSKIEDVYRLSAIMRPADWNELYVLGLAPKATLRRVYRDAVIRKTIFVDGKLAAMYGVCGNMISDAGEPYLLTAKPVELAPKALIKHGLYAVAEMHQHFRILTGYVIDSYGGAKGLLEMLGFKLDPPIPVGPQGALFCRYCKEA